MIRTDLKFERRPRSYYKKDPQIPRLIALPLMCYLFNKFELS